MSVDLSAGRRPVIVGVPTLSRYDLLDRFFVSAEDGILKPDRYLIVDNGGKFSRSPGVRLALARSARVSVLRPAENVGVAASWNAILREAGAEPAVVSNDDITLGPETLMRLYGDGGIGQHEFVIAEGPPHANGWCLFMQAPSCAAKVGYYDESFFPAYYEDTDYHHRMKLAGVEPFRLPTDHTHEGWATIKQEGHEGPTFRGQAKCLEYYVNKWGGAPGEERFAQPFNGVSTPAVSPRDDVWVDLKLEDAQLAVAKLASPSAPLMRYDVVNRVLEKLGADRYLEVGVSNGETMCRVKSKFRVGVDPNPQPSAVSAATEFYPVTSDKFFARGEAVGKFGVTFIDGHHADQVYRDIENACRVSEVIVVHNANPPTEVMQRVPYVGGDWTGDVWKAVARVRAEGQHAVRTIDSDFGVAVVLPGRGEDVPDWPRDTWIDLVTNRAELLGLLKPIAWEEWFDMANRRDRRAAKAIDRKVGIERGRICLNMIVRNEAKVIERCLESAAPFIDCWAIADTGSTDDTPAIIERFFAARGVPGKLVKTTFKDFSQARNEALAAARTVPGWEYALLLDADFVLTGAIDKSAMSAPSYTLMQTNGHLNWYNTRLVRRDSGAKYVGATHEHVAVANGGDLGGLVIHDRADGGTRGEKSERDIRLLNQDLADHPENQRSMFYLAQTYREIGRHQEAIQWYRRRIAAGFATNDWDEEIWAAHYGIALSFQCLGDEPEFIKACLEAYNYRPGRGEPMKVLARHFRERGQNESACLMAEQIPTSTADVLFVERWVYEGGADQELAIAGYYSKLPRRREEARRAWGRLTTCSNGAVRVEAMNVNAPHLARSAKELFGAEVRAIDWKPADGYAPMNPSVCVVGDRCLVLVRTVNYTVQDGQYPTLDGSGVIRTHDHVIEMDSDWRSVRSAAEIVDAPEMPARNLGFVEGYEDCRLWVAPDGSFRASCTVRDAPDSDGRCEMAILDLDAAWRVVRVDPIRDYEGDKTQKNWMPIAGRPGSFLYLCHPTVVIDRRAQGTVETHRSEPAEHLADLRGGSQVIPHGDGWLAITHEVAMCPQRVYLHRFVRFDANFRVTAVSDPYYFLRIGIEFCAGLARDGQRLVASFGVNDASAHLAFFTVESVDRSLRPLGR